MTIEEDLFLCEVCNSRRSVKYCGKCKLLTCSTCACHTNTLDKRQKVKF